MLVLLIASACSDATAPSTVRVRLQVQGNSNDSDGVVVEVGSARVRVTSAAEATLPPIAPGDYSAWVRDVSSNCWPTKDNVPVSIRSGQAAEIDVGIFCVGQFTYDRVDGNDYHIYYVDENGRTTQLTWGAGRSFVSDWSPDGKTIVYGHGASWPAVGLITQSLFVSGLDGFGSRLLAAPPDGYTDTGARWSPDGTRIAFYEGNVASHHTSPLMLVNADGSNLHAVFDDAYYYFPTWSPDGSRLAFLTGFYDPINFPRDIATARPDGSDRQPVGVLPEAGFADLSWSPDGSMFTILAFENSGSTLQALPARGGSPAVLWGDRNGIYEADWSPDSRRVILNLAPPTGGSKLAVIDRDGSNVTYIAGTLPEVELPVWSPDGTTLLITGYWYTQTGMVQHVYAISPDGAEMHQVTPDSGETFGAKWSPLARPGWDRSRIGTFARANDASPRLLAH